jgi:flagellum-specific peptidoglycan hydrolase FlgJ
LCGVGCGDKSPPVVGQESTSVEAPETYASEEQRRAILLDVEQWHVLPTEQGSLEGLFVESLDTELSRAALQLLIEQRSQDWPAGYRREFLSQLAPEALASAVETSIPASVTLAQAALESGWGRSGLAVRFNNLFGVKAWGEGAGVSLSTMESTDGVMERTTAQFRIYSTWSESLRSHNSLLSTDSRYSGALAAGGDWRTFIHDIAPIWASDPDYEARVSSIVERYALDDLDDLVEARQERVGK